MSDRISPEGRIWVCSACGKTAKHRYGDHAYEHDRGWDESCAMHAVLCYYPKTGELWEADCGKDDNENERPASRS